MTPEQLRAYIANRPPKNPQKIAEAQMKYNPIAGERYQEKLDLRKLTESEIKKVDIE